MKDVNLITKIMEKQIDKVLKGIKIIAIICIVCATLAMIWDFNPLQIDGFNCKFGISASIIFILVVITDLDDKEDE